MSAVQQQLPENEKDALAWASDHFPFKEQRLITDRPWGKTFQLINGTETAYLKLLPEHQSNAALTTPMLGELFSPHIPTSIVGDSRRGLLLLSSHQGKNLSRKPSSSQKSMMLKTYASIQIQAANIPSLLNQYTPIDIDAVVPRFLDFLHSEKATSSNTSKTVGAGYFIGNKDANTYHQLFKTRADLLISFISKAKGLQNTINHLDLRPSNAAESINGDSILYDWEESVVGPAGLSLHAMFSGCYKPIVLLADQQNFIKPESLRSARKLLNIYQQSLIDGKYTSKEVLYQRLGGSICAGLIHFLSSYSYYPKNSKSYKRTIAKHIKKRLSDLLNVCDFLTIVNDDLSIFDFVNQYLQCDRTQRAMELIDQYLHKHPMDPLALQQRGILLLKANNYKSAVYSFQKALEITPDDAALHFDLATAYKKLLNYKSALVHTRRSLILQPSDRQAQLLLKHITKLNNWYKFSNKTGTVPQVDFADRNSKLLEDKLALSLLLFKKYGVLQLNNIFDPLLLQQAHNAFFDKYNQYMENKRHKDALRIGDKRFQVTLELETPFNDELLIANPILLALMKKLLGEYFTIGAFTSSMSLPGAKVQRLHKDHKALFADVEDLGKIPNFAVTVMIPLINIDEIVGTTRVRKGSHVLTTQESKKLPSQSPIVNLGSCYLMDYRLSHYGQENQSSTARPIINMVYQRPWFRDYMNFKNQAAVQLSQQNFAAMPKSLKKLLAWTQEP